MTALAIGGIASLASGVANFAANASASERAAALQDKNLQEWLKIHIPDPAEQKIAMERFVQQGQLDPKLETAIKQDPSQFEKITTSVSNRNAQNRALSELEDIGYSGGLRLQDKAALQDAQMDGTVRDRANRNAIAADMQRKGLGGSGFEVASQLQGQSAGADRDANNSLKVAAMAQDRALQSIMGAGDMATKFRTQDFGEQSAKASAADQINRFNTTNLQDINQRNIASQNAAMAGNLAQKQKTADANTNLSNQEQQYNKGLLQQQFDNQAKVASGKSGQYGQMAANQIQQGQNMGNMFSNIGGGIAGVGTAIDNRDYWTKYFDAQKDKDKQKPGAIG